MKMNDGDTIEQRKNELEVNGSLDVIFWTITLFEWIVIDNHCWRWNLM